jgi:hypothetical protein
MTSQNELYGKAEYLKGAPFIGNTLAGIKEPR